MHTFDAVLPVSRCTALLTAMNAAAEGLKLITHACGIEKAACL